MSRLPRLRFSLRTLVIFVLLCGSGFGLWWRWEPWVLEQRVSWTTNTYGRYSTPAYGMVITGRSLTPAEEPLALSSDGRLLATKRKDLLRVIDTSDLRTIAAWERSCAVRAVFSEDGQKLATIGREQYEIYDLGEPAKSPISQRFRDYNGYPAVAVCSRNNRAAVSAGAAVNADSGNLVWEATELLMARAVAFSPDGQFLVIGTCRQQLLLLDASSGSLIAKAEECKGEARCLALSPSGAEIAVGCSDGTVMVFERPSMRLIRYWQAAKRTIWTIAYSPDSTRLLTVGFDCVVNVWDPRDGSPLAALEGHTRWVVPAVYLPGGVRILSASADGTLCTWHRRRPEWWWGIAWLPEFWFTLVFGVGMICSAWRDRRQWSRTDAGWQRLTL